MLRLLFNGVLNQSPRNVANPNKILPTCFQLNVANLKDLPDPPVQIVIGTPDQNKLKVVPKQPTYPSGMTIPKMTKQLIDVRVPELVHNKLIHQQYGIVALSGGNLQTGHFEMMRNTLNKNMDMKRSFAVWRVDPPWKPITRHGQGKKLGGGKGPIDHYVTPVRRGRVIVEVGGHVEYKFIRRLLLDVAQKLPFPAKFVSHRDLEEWAKMKDEIKNNNVNKLTWEWCLKNNTLNVINYISKYDLEFSNHGPY